MGPYYIKNTLLLSNDSINLKVLISVLCTYNEAGDKTCKKYQISLPVKQKCWCQCCTRVDTGKMVKILFLKRNMISQDDI